MTDCTDVFQRLGVKVPEICLPAPGVDMEKWAVVACDQYSSEPEYWEGVKAQVGDAPSTLNLIYPECYLEDADSGERIASIMDAMGDYIGRGIVAKREPGFILVERRSPYEAKARLGLMIAVDLEKYRYGKDSKSLIRPTEGTVQERLPPRMRIRRGARLELPHIMLLVDDSGRSVVEPLYQARAGLPMLYDFELMKGSGHVRAWDVSDRGHLDRVAASMEKLADPEAFEARYGNADVLLFAVGDGNHSLATAKAVWEEIKAAHSAGNADGPTPTGARREGVPAGLEDHPGRYALVELVNIYDPGLPFHPIHRVLFNVDEDAFLGAVRDSGGEILSEAFGDAVAGLEAYGGSEHRIGYLSSRGEGTIAFRSPSANLAAGTAQSILDAWLAANPGTGIDYIHGRESLEALARKPGNLGLYLPPVDKAGFFRTVIRDGVMPRKTFSMGEAAEKRFYVESRLIMPGE